MHPSVCLTFISGNCFFLFINIVSEFSHLLGELLDSYACKGYDVFLDKTVMYVMFLWVYFVLGFFIKHVSQ